MNIFVRSCYILVLFTSEKYGFSTGFSSNTIDNGSTITNANENGGYIFDEIDDEVRSVTIVCPSTNLISTKYKCQVRNKWVDCAMRHCCQGFNFVAGRCVPEQDDPCNQNICQQKCSIYFGKVICTCFSGYYFNATNHRNGDSQVCLDVNECDVLNGGCDHECINNEGSYSCRCQPGFEILNDNRTCEIKGDKATVLSNFNEIRVDSSQGKEANEVIHKNVKCYSSCNHVTQLESSIKALEERVVALSTAVRLYSFAAGPRGQPGLPGPPGPPGKQGFSETESDHWTSSFSRTAVERINDEDVPFNSWTVVNNNKKRKFCRCKRGPIGSPGASGQNGHRGLQGPQGPKGESGEGFDFLLLAIADIRHDIEQLQKHIFSEGHIPEPFDLLSIIKNDNGTNDVIRSIRNNNEKSTTVKDVVIPRNVNKTENQVLRNNPDVMMKTYENNNIYTKAKHEKSTQKSHKKSPLFLESKTAHNDYIVGPPSFADESHEEFMIYTTSHEEDYDDYSSFIGFKLKDIEEKGNEKSQN